MWNNDIEKIFVNLTCNVVSIICLYGGDVVYYGWKIKVYIRDESVLDYWIIGYVRIDFLEG